MNSLQLIILYLEKSVLVLYSLSLGAIATTLYNRIINNIEISYKSKPRCNRCFDIIEFPYFFPIIGYFLCKGKCKTCKMSIPLDYLFIEVSVTLLIFFGFCLQNPFINNLSVNIFITKSLFTTTSFILLLILIKENVQKIDYRILFIALIFGILYRTYIEMIDIESIALIVVYSIIFFHFLSQKIEFDLSYILYIIIILITTYNFYIIFGIFFAFTLLLLLLNLQKYLPNKIGIKINIINEKLNARLILISILIMLIAYLVLTNHNLAFYSHKDFIVSF